MDILIVDDDDICLRALSLMLKKKGAVVHTAKSAKASREFLESNKVDLILTDIGLPDVNQFELVDYFCNLEPKVPVVVISGHILEESAQALKSKGVIELLEKPIYASQIQNIVAELSTTTD
jgi:DNA-binding NtrC family response regulator